MDPAQGAGRVRLRTGCVAAFVHDRKEMLMNNPLAATVVGLAIASMAPSYAASYSSAEMRARQELVQSVTEAAVATTGARATAAQDARDVAISRQIPGPTLAERRADVLAGAVYPQSGPSTAALAASNAAVSRQISVPTIGERRTDVLDSAVYPQSGPAMAALAAKNADAQMRMAN